jgi:hypothetical protein
LLLRVRQHNHHRRHNEEGVVHPWTIHFLKLTCVISISLIRAMLVAYMIVVIFVTLMVDLLL